MIPNSILQMLSNISPAIRQAQNINSPDDAAQFLLNSGKVKQEQVNQAKQMWNQPGIRQMIQNRYRY